MEYSAVKEMLKGLCHESWGWSYAVLWKLKCDNPTMLVWEDGYCKPGFVDMPYEWDAIWRTSGDPLCQQRGHGGSLEILVFRFMFNQVHALGDGIVGRAASVGVHEWIIQTVQAGNKSVLVNDDLQLQFSAGIQTIAVIPVLPHGVLQLGSNRTIMENYGFVNQLKCLFLHLRATPDCPATTNALLDQSKHNKQESFAGKKIFNSSSEVLEMSPLDCYTDCEKISMAEVQNQFSPSLQRHVYGNTQYTASMQSLSPSLDSLMLARHPSGLSLQQTVSLLTNNHPSETFLGTVTPISEVIESSPQVSVSVRVSTVDNFVDSRMTSNCNSGSYKVAAWTSVQGPPSPSAGDSRCSMQPDCFTGDSDSFCSNPSYSLHKNDNDLFQALGIIPFASDEHMSSKCQSLYYESYPIKSAASENATPYSTREMELEAQVSTHASGDLSDALHVKVKSGKFCGNSNSADTSILEHYTNDGDASGAISTCMSELRQPLDEFNDSQTDTLIPRSAESESLLDAVVWKINSNAKQKSEGDVTCCTELTGSTSYSGQANTIPYNQRPSPHKVQEELLHMAPPVLARSKLIQASSSFDSVHYTNNTDKTLPVERKFTNPVKSFIENDKSAEQNSISSVRQSEMGKLNKKRTRPGEGSRPRPKDRQMIQDRLRDLREIIPNGAKYSIDALLERTIKHMLFLQSVTKHAEKIKQSGEWKGRDGGLPLKDNFEVGATWAFEVGSKSMICPIIVEDLSAPRQMLVEILCEEHGFFLEIADTLRGMGLTILKGVMESRTGSIWARFAVEAQKDVTRMDVFMSLMQFLEAAKINASNFNNGGHFGENTFQTATVPYQDRLLA